MGHLVLTASRVTTYDDVIEERYHFPTGPYLRAMERGVGCDVVFYEPRRGGGRQVYFAVARLAAIVPDPDRPNHAYGLLTDYVDFASPVPWRSGPAASFETGLAQPDGMPNKGLFGRAVRDLSAEAFQTIVALGMAPSRDIEPGQPAPLAADHDPRCFPPPAREVQWMKRPTRDRVFRASVQRAYQNTCAVTGLRLINGGGAAEIEAAHIQAVADDGPDALRNGLALSRTVHWMFDRFLFTLDNELRVVTAPETTSALPDHLIRSGQSLRRVPDSPHERPHPHFLRWHQERFRQKWG